MMIERAKILNHDEISLIREIIRRIKNKKKMKKPSYGSKSHRAATYGEGTEVKEKASLLYRYLSGFQGGCE